MNWMVWLFITAMMVMLLGVIVVRGHGRYRGRRRSDAGVTIFEPSRLP